MDSKVGMSLKIHGSLHGQFKCVFGWGGLTLNIKLPRHTHTYQGSGEGLLATTGSEGQNKIQLGATLIVIAHQVSADAAF